MKQRLVVFHAELHDPILDFRDSRRRREGREVIGRSERVRSHHITDHPGRVSRVGGCPRTGLVCERTALSVRGACLKRSGCIPALDLYLYVVCGVDGR
jgi:hypothetical protein